MEKNMNISVVTTFHQQGLNQYAQKMIDTFIDNWPEDVILCLYPENCDPVIKDSSRVCIKKLEEVKELAEFKQKWKDVPKANGYCKDSTQKFNDKTQKIGFKWDAVRFAHKVYAIFDCARNTDADVLFWMDADSICHSPISLDKLKSFCPLSQDLGFLGRAGKYTECGLYSMNLKSPVVKNFLREFQRMYDDAEHGIFTLSEWHDSFVFDAVRTKFGNQLKENNWSSGIIKGEGHPLINSEWGAYLDHLKGDRKTLGRSKDNDLKVKRVETYWQTGV